MAGDLNARTGCADMFPCLSLNFLSYNYNRLSVDDGWFCLLLIEIFFSSLKKNKNKMELEFTCEPWSFRRLRRLLRLRLLPQRRTWDQVIPNGGTLDDPVGRGWAAIFRRTSDP